MAFATRINTREFDRTLKAYMGHTRRDLATVMNTKAFYIARRATVNTPKANKTKIAAELRSPRRIRTVSKRGKARNVNTNLAGLIIMARRRDKGLSTKKKDIREDVKQLIASRIRSIAFIKSGWLPAIKRLEPLAERIGGAPARPDRTVKQFGKPKGSARPARPGVKPIAKITNDALPKVRGGLFKRLFSGNRSQVMQIAFPALQSAFDFEAKSMKDYIARKLTDRAKKLAIRTR